VSIKAALRAEDIEIVALMHQVKILGVIYYDSESEQSVLVFKKK
jgi:hypothetical protein